MRFQIKPSHAGVLMRKHLFAGLGLCSAIPLPELPSTALGCRYALKPLRGRVLAASNTVIRHEWRDASGNLTLAHLECDTGRCLSAPGLATAFVAGTHITLQSDARADAAAVRHVLLNQILPRVLDGDGEFMLHAGMVADAGKPCLMLVGETCYGKSTLAAGFVQAGARGLTDDGVRLTADDTVVHAFPTYPGLRLRPDSSAALCGDAGHSVRIDMSGATDGLGDSCAIGVGAIVVLDAPSANADIILRPLSPGEAAMALVQNSFALDPNDVHRARQRLGQAARVASAVPAYRFGYPRQYTRLPDVVACLRSLM